VSFIEKTNIIVIRSDNCIGSSAGRQLSCVPCESLPQSLKFLDFIARAKAGSYPATFEVVGWNATAGFDVTYW
jgi:hypothetical protein